MTETLSLRNITTARPGASFRPDIQGLRAIAVGLVVLYHAGLPGLTGGYVGVDVFFVISGFLITGHLVSRLDATGQVGFTDFYARRVRRLLPASLTVVVLTVICSVLFIEPLRITTVLKDAVATILYVPNFYFYSRDTDYLADTQPSPFLHYWSLGVEEQFYLLWPLILMGAFLLFRRSNRQIGLMLSMIVALSFAACVLVTLSNPTLGFYASYTRAWEFGIGGLVALAVRSPRVANLPRPLVVAANWFGLLTLVAVAVAYTERTTFPGYAAALPVLATALLILGGAVTPRGPVQRMLTLRPMLIIGLLSYSIYLVHWPLLIITQGASDPVELPLWFKLVLAVATVPLAALLYRYVETPGRTIFATKKHGQRITLLVSGVLVAILVVAFVGTAMVTSKRKLDAGRVAADAPASSPPVDTSYVPSNLAPALRAATSDNPVLYADGCHVDQEATAVQDCRFGSSATGSTVALFGDSHATQWFPALDVLAEQGQFSLATYTKSSCPAFDVQVLINGAEYPSCEKWRAAVIDRLRAEKPNLVIITGKVMKDLVDDSIPFADAWANGAQQTVATLSAFTRVLVIADTPHFVNPPAVCLSAHLSDADVCGGQRSVAVDSALQGRIDDATKRAGGMVANFNDYLCSTTVCPAIIGSNLVYRDEHHLTQTMVRTLAGPVGAVIDSQLHQQ